MRRNGDWPLDLAAVGLIFVLLFLVVTIRPRDPVPEVKPRVLADKPRELFAREIIIPTAGCQVEDGRLVWRKFASGPPLVVLEFPEGLPDPPPKKVKGTPFWEESGPVRVAGCRGYP